MKPWESLKPQKCFCEQLVNARDDEVNLHFSFLALSGEAAFACEDENLYALKLLSSVSLFS